MDAIQNEVALAAQGNFAAQQRLVIIISTVYKNNKAKETKENKEEASLRQNAEREIITQMIADDSEVAQHMLAIIFNAHYAKIAGYLTRRFTALQQNDAEDIANDVLFKFFTQARKGSYQYRSGHTLKAFLYTTAFREAIRWVSKNKLTEEFDDSKQQDKVDNHSSLSLDYLTILPEDQQRVIEQTLEGYIQEEIAKKMGISRRTVNALKKKALDTLRSFFEEETHQINPET